MNRRLLIICGFLVIAMTGTIVGAQTNDEVLHLSNEAKAALPDKAFWDWGLIISTGLGGVVAGGVGIWLNRHAHSLEQERAQATDKMFQVNLLRAIRREFEMLGNIFDTGIGKQIFAATPGKPVFAKLGLTMNWFLVFEANAGHLGQVDGRLSRSAIAIYLQAKQIIEELRINNEYIGTRQAISFRIHERPNEEHLKRSLADIEQLMLEQKAKIEAIIEAVKKETESFFQMLDAEGIK